MPNEYTHNYSVWFANNKIECNYRIIRWNSVIVANFGTNDFAHTILPNVELGNKYDVVLKNGVCVVNGEEVELSTDYTYYEGNIKPITIFDRLTTDRYTYGRLYYFRIIKNGRVVLDLIPVRKGNKGFMYDKVNRKLLSGIGEGTFTLGPDVN